MARLGGWWKPFGRYTTFRMARRGRRDARLDPPVPHWDAEELPPALRELLQAGNHDMDLVGREWAEDEDLLAGAVSKADRARRLADESVTSAETDLSLARAQYSRWNGDIESSGAEEHGSIAYVLLLAFLAVVEFPLNVNAFRLFGEVEAFTWVAAAMVGGILLGCGHVLGEKLHERTKWTWQKLVVTISVTLAPIGAIVATAYLRQVFLDGQVDDGIFQLEGGAGLAVLIALNMAILVVGTVFSYRLHTPGRRELRACRRAVESASARRAKASDKLTDAITAYEARHAELTADAEWLQEEVNRLAEAYREQNLNHRSDRGKGDETGRFVPASFETPLTLERPAHLTRVQNFIGTSDPDSDR